MYLTVNSNHNVSVQTAGESDVFLKSDLRVRLSTLLFVSDQDRISASTHHRHICMCCSGNNVGVSHCARLWRGFPTQKLEKWRSIITVSERTIHFSASPPTVPRVVFEHGFRSAAPRHVRDTGFDICRHCVSSGNWHKRRNEIDFEIRNDRPERRTEMHLGHSLSTHPEF